MFPVLARRAFVQFFTITFVFVLVGVLHQPALAADDRFPAAAPLPDAHEPAQGPLSVVATNSILADIAAQIGGARVTAISLIPANADPHDFEPSPEELVAVEEADLVITHGLGLDRWIADVIEDTDSTDSVIVATDGVETLASADNADEPDPHVWFDPQRGAQLAANIAAGLSAVDPEGAADYQKRLSAYQRSLDDLDQAIGSRFTTLPESQRVMVTNHDSLAYFADRYGLTVVGTVIPGGDTQSEPSALEMSELLDTIDETGVQVIFAENTVDSALATALASESGIEVVAELYTDSLGDADSGADTYYGLLTTNAAIIFDNLAGQ